MDVSFHHDILCGKYKFQAISAPAGAKVNDGTDLALTLKRASTVEQRCQPTRPAIWP